ncbi:hypothetical protein SETIT_4G142700v2 [Setaria italica]|uniref:DNA helicase Pif1-like 2B domain-containing protein n=1 Tax=Setaria italica TaxID=4555 RepID=A0A368QU35_SETIT|nr:hypothetical protein SETIT_4G142700v2 [Setaria italica]
MAASGLPTEQVKEFNDWVLSNGDGTTKGATHSDDGDSEFIEITHYISIPSLETSYSDPTYLRERAIMAPKNGTIDETNSRVLSLIPGIPPHKLVVKIGSPVMLLRNLNQSAGLCNGTRLIITQLGDQILEAQIITGSHIGDKILLPRIALHLYVAISRVTSRNGLKVSIDDDTDQGCCATLNIVYKDILQLLW